MYEVVQSFPKTPQSFTVAPSIVSPPVKPWGRDVEILVLGTVSCASVVFLFLTVIICYKAIKRYQCPTHLFTSKSRPPAHIKVPPTCPHRSAAHLPRSKSHPPVHINVLPTCPLKSPTHLPTSKSRHLSTSKFRPPSHIKVPPTCPHRSPAHLPTSKSFPSLLLLNI
ncbi:proline-rich membrane anchor 1 [Tachysurus ichikawai]